MAVTEKVPVPQRISQAAAKTFRSFGARLVLIFFSIVPISLVIMLLNASGLLASSTHVIDRGTSLFGLRGEALIVFAASAFGNIYAALAVLNAINFSEREISILALMCLLAHNLFAECGRMKKTGSLFSKFFFFRIFWALAAGLLLNLSLPGSGTLDTTGRGKLLNGPEELSAFFSPAVILPLMLPWIGSVLVFFFCTALIVLGTVFLQYLLLEFGLLKLAARIVSPFMGILGLPSHASQPLVSSLAFDIREKPVQAALEGASLTEKETDLLNHHRALNHSWIIDTPLFSAAGAGVLLLLLPRLLLAVVVVWIEKGRRSLFRRSFRVQRLEH